MRSPAKDHFRRVAAATIGAADAPQNQVSASQYELMLAKLAEDRRRLKDLQSIERKAEVKRELLPEYRPWIQGVLEGGSGQQDDVLMTVLVWNIDVGDLPAALEIGRYAIDHKLVMPDQYKRDVPTVLAEEFADQSLKLIAAEKPADLEALIAVAELTAESDMPDEVRAKLYKAIGYAQRMNDDPVAAKESLTKALSMHDKIGVKKDIERLETAIKNLAGSGNGNG